MCGWGVLFGCVGGVCGLDALVGCVVWVCGWGVWFGCVGGVCGLDVWVGFVGLRKYVGNVLCGEVVCDFVCRV